MHEPGQDDDLDLSPHVGVCLDCGQRRVLCAFGECHPVPPGTPQGALARAPQSHARTPVLRLVGVKCSWQCLPVAGMYYGLW